MKIRVDNFDEGQGPREINVDLSTLPDDVLIFFGQSYEARAEMARRAYTLESKRDWDPADHPRAPAGTHEGGRFIGNEITHLVDEAIQGGFSFNPVTHSEPTTGFMVARAGRSVDVPAGSKAEARQALKAYLKEHWDEFAREPDLFVGGWVDKGRLIIEPSDQVFDRVDAVTLGQGRDQIAIFDVENLATIDTGGSGGEHARPEFDVAPARVFGEKVLLPTAERLGHDDRGAAGRLPGRGAGPAVPGGRDMTWNIDETDQDADWIKTLSWDLPTEPDAFLRAIGGRERLDHFMTLPAAKAMPQPLRQALGVIEGTMTVLTPEEMAALRGMKDTPS